MCLKDTSFLSTSTGMEAEQHMLLFHAGSHKQCSSSPSTVKDTGLRKKEAIDVSIGGKLAHPTFW